MGRPKGSGKKSKPIAASNNPATSSLLESLKFLQPAIVKGGQPGQTHCQLANKTAVIFNGTQAIGCLIDTDISANPNLELLIAALSKCTAETQITQLDAGRLSIKSGRFQAYVPCIDGELLAPVIPATACAPCDDRVKASLAVVSGLVVENAPRIVEASIMLRAGSAVATDGKIMFEHWHGIDMPVMIIPKTSAAMLLKINKKLISFGVTPATDNANQFSSVTFYFDDNSWWRTQLYIEPYPDVDRILNTPSNQWPIPAGLWEGLETIKDFADDDFRVFLEGNSVRTHFEKEAGASCQIEGALPTIIVDYEYLMHFAPHVKTVDFMATEMLIVFQGENFRGVLAKIKA